MKMSVAQMSSSSDFELPLHVFLVLQCRCISVGIATRALMFL